MVSCEAIVAWLPATRFVSVLDSVVIPAGSTALPAAAPVPPETGATTTWLAELVATDGEDNPRVFVKVVAVDAAATSTAAAAAAAPAAPVPVPLPVPVTAETDTLAEALVEEARWRVVLEVDVTARVVLVVLVEEVSCAPIAAAAEPVADVDAPELATDVESVEAGV